MKLPSKQVLESIAGPSHRPVSRSLVAVAHSQRARISSQAVSQCPRRPIPAPTRLSRTLRASIRRLYATETTHVPQIPDISPQNTYDIVIIGGGNAGLALACALRELPSTPLKLGIQLTDQWISHLLGRLVASFFWKEVL